MFPLNTAGRIGLNVALLLAGVLTLRFGQPVIVPLMIALLLASVLGPAAMWLHQTAKFPWSLSCVTVVVALVLMNMLVVAVFSASVMRLVNQLSNRQTTLELYKDFRIKLEKFSIGPIDPDMLPPNPQDIDEIGVLKYLREATPQILGQAAKYTSVWSADAIIILFVTFFLLLEGRMLAQRVVAILGPSEEVQGAARNVLFEMANQVRTYLVWRTAINIVLGVVMWAVYQVAGLPQALTWAILLVILNYIPYLGPVLASIPPFLDAFIFRDPAIAVLVTVLFWLVIIIEGYLIVPLVMGRNMDLNATTVMVACLFWEAVWGPTGLFLAMPIMAGAKAILHSVPEWRPWANLMSTTGDPLPRPLMRMETANGTNGDVHAEPQRVDGPV